MYYMNKTKRNLILAAAIVNLLSITANLVMAIVLLSVDLETLMQNDLMYILFAYSQTPIFTFISFGAGLVGSILLIYAVRKKGKYFRQSIGYYYAGFIIIIVCGGFLPWILLLISMFVSDVIIINAPNEVKKEQKMEDKAYEDKKQKIEELQKLRDSGVITEEEYKQKLFEIL